ncbi:MAG: MFS transporter [Proteobacteria bacterium]|nr:MFS transporter [Pseudomonadota bacterium]
MSNSDKIFTSSFISVMLINFFTFFSFQMIFPTLPLYIHSLGGGDAVVGLVMGLFTVTSLLTRPFAGVALDMLGRRRVFLFGLCVLALTAFSYSFATAIVMIALVRLLHGIGWGIAGTSSATIAADLLPKKRLGEGIGYFALANSLSMAIAPAAGLYLARRYGYSDEFKIAGFLVLISIFLALVIKYKPYKPHPAALKEGLYERSAFGPSFMVFCTSSTFSGIASFLPLYAAGQNIHNIGWFFTVYAGAIFISRLLTGKIVDRYGYSIVLIPGFLALIAALLIISRAHDMEMFMVSAVVFGLGFGITQMTLQTMVVRNVPSTRLGAANATFYSGVDMGNGLGALTLGSLAELVGYADMFACSALIIVAALSVYVLYLRPRIAFA